MYLKFNCIKNYGIDDLKNELKNDCVRNNKFLFLYCVQRFLEAKKYLRVNKMLVYCEHMKWYCPRFYQLRAKFKAESVVNLQANDEHKRKEMKQL